MITFHGFLKAYVEGTDDAAAARDDDETRLPDAGRGRRGLRRVADGATGHETKPPARYTEATLIKELEDREIGRPSTYASIIGTILNRGYVYKKGTALVPAWLAFSVIRLLEEHFAAAGRPTSSPPAWRTSSTRSPAAARTATPSSASSTSAPATSSGLHDAGQRARRHRRQGAGDLPGRRRRTAASCCGSAATAPTSRAPTTTATPAGKRANVPDDLPPDELTLEKAKELLANPAGEEIELGTHPETGLRVVAKNGRFGPYVTEVLPEDAPEDGQAAHRLAVQVDVARHRHARGRRQAARRCRAWSATDAEGVEITAQNGRYGPYLKKGTDSRSLTTEDQLFTITLDEALAIYAQPKQRGRAAAAPPLKELGNDPVSGQPVVVKAGRFGEYVTDGEYNATLRKDDSVEAITLERAAELLAERRAKGPAKKTAKKGAKKAPAKKTAAKKTAQEDRRQEDRREEGRRRRSPDARRGPVSAVGTPP